MMRDTAVRTRASLPAQMTKSRRWKVKERENGLEKRSTSHLYTGDRKKIISPVFCSMTEYRKESARLRRAATTRRSVLIPSRLKS